VRPEGRDRKASVAFYLALGYEVVVRCTSFTNQFVRLDFLEPYDTSEGRRYLLAGMVRCGICGRRMQGQWKHGQPYYRCKDPSDYPIDETPHPKSVYVRESATNSSESSRAIERSSPSIATAMCVALRRSTPIIPVMSPPRRTNERRDKHS
jgi:Recombinase zinc beta ribbon domain